MDHEDDSDVEAPLLVPKVKQLALTRVLIKQGLPPSAGESSCMLLAGSTASADCRPVTLDARALMH